MSTKEVILTKGQVENIYLATEEALRATEPLGIRIMLGFAGASLVTYSADKVAMSSSGFAFFYIAAGIITGTMFLYADQNNKYSAQLLNDHSEIWLDTMNRNNLSEIKLQLFNYQAYLDGTVQYTRTMPNVLGYKDSAGNWIMVY